MASFQPYHIQTAHRSNIRDMPPYLQKKIPRHSNNTCATTTYAQTKIINVPLPQSKHSSGSKCPTSRYRRPSQTCPAAVPRLPCPPSSRRTCLKKIMQDVQLSSSARHSTCRRRHNGAYGQAIQQARNSHYSDSTPRYKIPDERHNSPPHH